VTTAGHEDALRALATISDLSAVVSDEQLGQGPTEVLNSHYSVVSFPAGTQFAEGETVEKAR
jgi:hypothetical protein